jgi:hypothetical protein
MLTEQVIELVTERTAEQPRHWRFPVNKAKVNYWVDVAIGVAGLMSAISGLIFVLPGDPSTGLLGVSYQAWNSLHTWSSLAAIAGVGAHMALHWRWIVAMTRQMFSPTKQQQGSERVPEAAYGDATSGGLSRRAFLAFGGAATVVVTALVAGYKAISDASVARASPSGSQLTATSQEGGVACPFGLVNDPYPGRCRYYRDSNSDGICDYSVAGSGSNLSTSDDGSLDGGFSRHRAGLGRP